ncbi:MAG: amidohydrolase family protein [Pirellulales bacterium]|nr:amidohydrolase family protein [Pirellulales bacterium]
MIDAHQHFWDRTRIDFDHAWQEGSGMEKICRSFLPTDLKPLLEGAGVDRSVFVQTQHKLEENRWALGLAEQYDFIAGVVGWIDLASSACEQQLLEFEDCPKFVGVRHVTQDEPDDDFIVRSDVLRGLKILEKHEVPFDLLFFVKHLHHAERLGRELPDLPMVIDHIAKPEIKSGRIDNWRSSFSRAASCDNIYCKLSGMITEADWENWKPSDLKPYVETALDLFGPERLMYGSDWPVCELAGSYQQQFDAVCEAVGPLGESEVTAIFGGTAARFYGLGALPNASLVYQTT